MADIYLSLSIQESFGQTISEALACGVPVVAFETSGILDQVEHKRNGYLAKIRNIEDIIKGIFWCISSEDCSKRLPIDNTMEKVGNLYYELFQGLLTVESFKQARGFRKI